MDRCLIFAFYSFAVCLTHVFVYFAALYSVWFVPHEYADSYDYVIVGAGTAGTTIMAGMRSGDSVLLIEAGRKTYPSVFFDMPIVSPALQRTAFDWSYETVPQLAACWAMNGRKCRLAAGRGYGGSSILNNMIFSRGHPEDYRGWFCDRTQYNYSADIEPLFRDIEAELPIRPLSYQSKLGQGFAQGFRSDSGKIRFENVRVIQRNGARWSIGHALWEDFPLPKHHVLLDASVRRLLFDDDPNVVSGIEFYHSDRLRTVRIRKAAILSAGTIGSPVLLQRSGIGSCAELERLSIACRADLPAVGSNLQDHLATGIDLVTLNQTVGNHLWNLLHPINGFNYVFGTGPSAWSTVGCEALGYRFEDDRRAPRIGFMAIPIRLDQDGGIQLRLNINLNATVWQQYFRHLPEQTVSIIPIVLRPKSRGFVRIESKNGDGRPTIDPRYLTHPADIETLIDGIRLLRSEILKAPQLQCLGARLTDRPFSECGEKFDTHAYWRCYVRHLSFSVFHSIGTCRMGEAKNRDTVVDRNFRVKGFRNLFVADASIMPNPPSANTNAAVMMVAKKFLKVLNQINSLENRDEINVARDHDEL